MTTITTIGDVLKEAFPPSIGEFTGKYVRIPITVNRARRDWNDAVAWLEERKAADEEWPWPKRADFDYPEGWSQL